MRPMPDGSHVGRSASATLLTLPNVITFARLCAVPLAVWLVMEHQIRPGVLPVRRGRPVRRGGWLAGAPLRRRNTVGALLDPVADKALLVTMYMTLAAVDILPDWLAILVVFRDLVIVGGIVVLSLLGHSVLIRPLYVSKLNTVFRSCWSPRPAADRLRPGRPAVVLAALIWLVAATTLASGAAYVWVTVRRR